MTSQPIGPVLQSFFLDALITMKGLRPSSVCSYRDGIKLFVRFVADVGSGNSDRIHSGNSCRSPAEPGAGPAGRQGPPPSRRAMRQPRAGRPGASADFSEERS